MKIDAIDVADHYGDSELINRIFDGLSRAGIDRNELPADALSPVEEFHIGGRQATIYALSKLALDKNQHVLDVGCGIGGAVRYLARHVGCDVSAIDLTPEYIAAAKVLTEMTGLDQRIRYHAGSALHMPYQNENFDAGISMHVAMNIADRPSLYGEMARVLKPGAALCIYDVMKNNDQQISFPLPWAESEKTSYLVSAESMHGLLQQAGFVIDDIEDRTDFALEFFRDNLSAVPKPLGIHIVMGENAREKMQNTLANIKRGSIAPVQIIARRVGL